jgi:hypothetical protein
VFSGSGGGGSLRSICTSWRLAPSCLSRWLLALAYPAARIDAWVCGLILMAVSAAALAAFADLEELLALLLGLWMLASPWALGFPHTATKVHVAVGLLVAYLAGLELWLTTTRRAATSLDTGKRTEL